MKRNTQGKELLAVKKRFEHWRQKQKRSRGPLPQELWASAVDVARKEGIHRTAKVLRLNHSNLKKRLEHAEAERNERGMGATFVQLQMPMSGSEHQTRPLVIELSGPHGERMRVEAADTAALDVVGLAQAFWSQAS